MSRSDRDECIQQLVERQAAQTPDAPAVVYLGQGLTYCELEERSGRLAAHLLDLGVRPDTLVGLATERSLDMLVGVLAILKAGGAYVPLDPSYPPDRLTWIWDDARRGNLPGRPAVLLTQRPLAGLLPQDGAIYLDDLPELPPPSTSTDVRPDNTAYVIYTSGSTGRPKGVVVPHRGVVNMMREGIRLLDVRPGDRPLQLSSLGFDASVLDIFPALTIGACVVLTPRQTLLSGEALGSVLRNESVTHVVLPPSLLDMVPAGVEKDAASLRSILVGGEACSAATAARWAPGRRMINAYAPTEATVFATASFCSGQGLPTLGGPIEEMTVQLLDPDGLEVAGEGDGEIGLGGVGVVRGYLNRPDLTAERFVPDAGSAQPGARLYRSGDLARRLPDGDLLFLGRIDFQVKVRGNRIELGEIEAVLGEHGGVQTAVVVALPDGGTKRLVSYVVRREPDLTVSALRSFLISRLPEYMIPSAFVFLDAMPMTPTGKVDRKALPDPGRSRPELDTAYAPPRDAGEEALVRIWSDLLGLEGIGVHDNLFELGGHSLLAAQIVTRVRDELSLDIPLPEVFDHPTVESLARRIAFLRESVPEEELPPIETAPRDQPIPLSFAQERVWFLTQLSPGNWAYNFQFTVRFRGPLQPAVLEAALSEVIRRHEVLRTTFLAVDGRPVQVIHPAWWASVPVVDLRGLAKSEREPLGLRLVQQEIRKAFDLERLPLLRWLLLRLDDDDHLLLQVEHHFVHDGWSLAVFLREVKEIYTAFHAGQPSPLPEPPIQYADFSVWQRKWLQGDALQSQLAWWTARLAGSPPVLELPADRPRPKAHSFHGAALRSDLPRDLYADVRNASRREGVTLFMSSLAAFCALLYRYTGQTDLLLGSGIANRRLRELEAMVGMVVNTIVFRAAIEGDATFRELVARVRRTTLDAHVHQDVPFEKIVEELQPDRELSRNPLFQVLFSFHDSPVPDLDFAGLTGELFERHNGSAKSDLNVVAKPRAEQRIGFGSDGVSEDMTFIWEYSGDLFDGATIDRMWAHYKTLLRAFVEDPGRRVSELPLLSESERRQLVEWSGQAAAEEVAIPVHLQVAAWAERTPDALAVAGNGVRLSYAELMQHARALAGNLLDLGTGPESIVAVCTERSPEAIVAALGILEAGAAWLPLDPSYPPERLRFLLEDSGARAVVVKPEWRSALPSTDLPVFDLDLGRGKLEAGGGQEGGLAYLIYTSGSTGRPKGVEISHQGLANLVAWHQSAYEVTPADRATMLAGPAFDASVWEVWPYLAAGASVHVPDADTRSDPSRLLGWMAAEGITLSFLPTPLAEALVEIAEREVPAGLSLRALLTGGDRLRRAPERALPFALVNHYGPTESTVVTTAGEVAVGHAGAPSIGQPIAGLGVWLLDRDLRRVPPGIPGELCVGGQGLARGYHGRPDLTAERFIPAPGGRLYRTGDLARWRDGELEFLGRIDQQVKIRGFRIELGEIETILGEHPEVREAVVTVRERGGENVLVAYPVGQGEEESLRAFLAERLPAYMVPSVFVFLPSLPLTPNGKIDLRALPEPAWSDAERGEDVPSTPLEETIARIWAAVLGIDAVGIHDNFFKLGGHSLIATRVLSRVRDAAGVDVPLAALFEAPTVADFARAVEEKMRGVEAFEGSIPRRASAEPAPVSFAQERLWFLDQLTPGLSAYSIVRAFRLQGPLETDALVQAAAEVVRRHEALRTTFAAVDDRPVQVIGEGLFAAEVTEVSSWSDAENKVREEAERPFDLQSGPLLRIALLRLAPDEHCLLLAMHHIVSDGWSMGVLFRELSALYGGTRALPDLPVQYGDFAVWQRERLQGGRLERLLSHWREGLAGAPAVTELPLDRPRAQVQSYRGDQEEHLLPQEVSEALRGYARQSGATLFMGLLAAIAALLSRYASRSDVVVGSPVAGRTRSELEPLIGFFVNTLALRLRWDGDPGFAGLLDRARRTVLAAHAHQELPFEKLVAELSPERSLGHTPLFQVLLTLQEKGADALEIPGITAESVPVFRGESRFDLELGAVEGGVDGGLRMLWRYDRDLFDGPTVARMAGHCEQLLRGFLAHPDRRLSDQPLLSPAEEEQLLRAVEPALLVEGAETLHALFLAQALRTPDAPAVISASAELTYRELQARSARLAQSLRARGVGPEVPVGVLLERTPDLVVALLAILQAGGFYVPLDPSYPSDRTDFLLEDSGARIVIREVEEAEAEPVAGAEAGPGNLAYVIYTSGSTGRPKGVGIEHRSAVALLRWAAGVFPPDDLAGVFASTSICFDLSIFEIFLPLSRGGALVLGDNALDLASLPVADRVTLINTVPSAMEELLRLEAVPPSVRTVNLAGEPLPAALADRIRRQTSAARVFDLYGPSEDTTYSTFALRETGEPATIGKPIAGSRAVLLDPWGSPVPRGVPGEIYLGGAGLARGYLGRPDLTAERFVPDPFSGSGERLYRTGDLARRREDGNLEFLGRIDHQVKVRGFRIELGEIEAALLAHAGVREAAVGVLDENGNRRLVAWVAPQGESLREVLAERLPSYMVPSDFVVLPALPRTPNGKLDRKALPRPEMPMGGDCGDGFVPPGTPEEETLAGIWAEVLGLERVGIHDDFFRLGGHSLLVVRLMSRVRRELQVDLPLRSLFQTPTVAGLAQAVQQAGSASAPRIAAVSRAGHRRVRSSQPGGSP